LNLQERTYFSPNPSALEYLWCSSFLNKLNNTFGDELLWSSFLLTPLFMALTVFIVGQLIFLQELHLGFLDLHSFWHLINFMKFVIYFLEPPHFFLHFGKVICMNSDHVGLYFFLIWYLVRVKYNLKLIILFFLLFLLLSRCFFHLFYSILDFICWVD